MRRIASVSAAVSLACVILLIGCNRPTQQYAMVDYSADSSVIPLDLYSSDPVAPISEMAQTEFIASTDISSQEPVDWTTDETVESTHQAMHVVAKGDTLFGLARQYYYDQARWKDIYEANSDQLGNPDTLRVGQQLIIP